MACKGERDFTEKGCKIISPFLFWSVIASEFSPVDTQHCPPTKYCRCILRVLKVCGSLACKGERDFMEKGCKIISPFLFWSVIASEFSPVDTQHCPPTKYCRCILRVLKVCGSLACKGERDFMEKGCKIISPFLFWSVIASEFSPVDTQHCPPTKYCRCILRVLKVCGSLACKGERDFMEKGCKIISPFLFWSVIASEFSPVNTQHCPPTKYCRCILRVLKVCGSLACKGERDFMEKGCKIISPFLFWSVIASEFSPVDTQHCPPTKYCRCILRVLKVCGVNN